MIFHHPTLAIIEGELYIGNTGDLTDNSMTIYCPALEITESELCIVDICHSHADDCMPIPQPPMVIIVCELYIVACWWW